MNIDVLTLFPAWFDWFAEQLTHGVRFTTTGRDAYVEVTVPDADAPEAGVLGDLAQAIRSSVPTVS